MLSCFCGKKKRRSAPSHSSLDLSQPLEQPFKLQVDLDLEDTLKLEAIRQQLAEAQKKQAPVGERMREEVVVGYVEVPLYRKEGGTLVDAGESYQVLMYDK